MAKLQIKFDNLRGPDGRTLTDLYNQQAQIITGLAALATNNADVLAALNTISTKLDALTGIGENTQTTYQSVDNVYGRLGNILTALTTTELNSLLGQLIEINWATGGHNRESLSLTTVRGLLARLVNLNTTNNQLLGKSQEPAGLCSPSFVSTGTKLHGSGQFTCATWGVLSPTGVFIRGDDEILEFGSSSTDWRIYVDSAAVEFFIDPESETTYPTNQWVYIDGVAEVRIGVPGDVYLTAYVCGRREGDGGGDPDPGGSENPEPAGCAANRFTWRIIGWELISNTNGAYNVWRPRFNTGGMVVGEYTGSNGKHVIGVNTDVGTFTNACIKWDFTGQDIPLAVGRDLGTSLDGMAASQVVDTPPGIQPDVYSLATEMERTGTNARHYLALNFRFAKSVETPTLNVWLGENGQWEIS